MVSDSLFFRSSIEYFSQLLLYLANRRRSRCAEKFVRRPYIETPKVLPPAVMCLNEFAQPRLVVEDIEIGTAHCAHAESTEAGHDRGYVLFSVATQEH